LGGRGRWASAIGAEDERRPLALAVGAPAPQQQREGEHRKADQDKYEPDADAHQRPQQREPDRREDDSAEHIDRVAPELARAEAVGDGGHLQQRYGAGARFPS
jgi:hypothetical protein